MSVTIQDNFSTAAAKPTDARYGPYNSPSAAATAIPEIYRYQGLTVGVLNSGVVEEYWWDNLLTGNPVKKTSVGNITSISQGTGILVSTTSPNSVQAPGVSIDPTIVQVISNLSTNVSTDGTSDVKYPSVKAVKTYADGLIVGLLNDRGSFVASTTSPGPYPSTGGSGTPVGTIVKGDIWFIKVSGTGYLGTTPVITGSSVRAIEDSPGQDSTKWDILDVGLGFTPENVANKVTTGANVNADPTSQTKYPSVKALVEYIQSYSPSTPTPNLQAVTDVAPSSTTNTISAASFKFNEASTSNYAELLCTSTGVVTIKDSLGNKRLSLNKTGTDLTVWTTSGTVNSILDFASVGSTQTFTFPNATGTIALLSSISGTSPINYNTSTGVISMPAATASTNGYLTQGDWSIFNNKQNSLSGSGIVKSTAGVISYISGTASQFVKGDGSLDSTVYLSSSSASTTYVPYTGATTNVNLGTTIATGKNLYCSSIGIGTNSPSGRLHISSQGDGGGDINVLFTQGIVNSLISTGNGPNGMTIGTSTNYNTYVQAGGLKVITVTSSPSYNVGIGISSPSYKLDVNGLINSNTGLIIRPATNVLSSLIFAGTAGTNGVGQLNLSKEIGGNFYTANLTALHLSADRIINLPNAAGTLVSTIATTAGNLTTGTDGKVTIVDATTSTRGLLSSTDWNTFNNKVNGSGTTDYLARWSGPNTLDSSSFISDDGTIVSFTQPTTGVGTVSVSSGSNVITGVGTKFLNTFKKGDTITIGSETRTIDIISTDTSITTTATFSTGNSGVPYSLVGGTRFVVRGNGNVGIGTTTPNYTLDVSGSGNYYLSGNTPSSPYGNKLSVRNGALRLGFTLDATNVFRYIQFTDEGDTVENFAFGCTSGVYNPGLGVTNPANTAINNPVMAMAHKNAFYITSGGVTATSFGGIVFTFKKDGRVRYTPIPEPTTDLEIGDTYYDNSSNKLRVYTPAGWEDCN